MLLGGLLLAVMASPTGELAVLDVSAISPNSCSRSLYLLVMGSLVAFTVYGWMLRVAPLPLVATYAYVNPIVAVILGSLILSEPIDARTVLAGGDRGRGRGHRDRSRAGWRPRARRPGAVDGSATASTAHPLTDVACGGLGGRPLPALGRPRLATDRAVLAIAQGIVGLDERVELARPFVDDRRLRVAQVALHRELVRVPVRAVDLDRVERALDRVLGGMPLGEARLARVAKTLVLQPARAPDEQSAHLGPRGHLRDELLDELVLADLLPERLPLVGVAERASRHAWASPTAPAATVYRPWSIALIATRKPSPSSPIRFSAGTATLSRLISPVLPARMPSLPWSVPVVRPAIPRSSMNAVTPLWFFDRSTVANTRKWSAMSASEIQIFWPLSRYASPSRRAVVARLAHRCRRRARSARTSQASRREPAGRASAGAAPRCPTGGGPAS